MSWFTCYRQRRLRMECSQGSRDQTRTERQQGRLGRWREKPQAPVERRTGRWQFHWEAHQKGRGRLSGWHSQRSERQRDDRSPLDGVRRHQAENHEIRPAARLGKVLASGDRESQRLPGVDFAPAVRGSRERRSGGSRGLQLLLAPLSLLLRLLEKVGRLREKEGHEERLWKGAHLSPKYQSHFKVTSLISRFLIRDWLPFHCQLTFGCTIWTIVAFITPPARTLLGSSSKGPSPFAVSNSDQTDSGSCTSTGRWSVTISAAFSTFTTGSWPCQRIFTRLIGISKDFEK